MISLSGEWKVYLDKTEYITENGDSCSLGRQSKIKVRTAETITLPGTVNGSGLGEKTGPDTEWNSGLFNPFWYEREEYRAFTGGEEGSDDTFKVPFLSQPKTSYTGTAVYEKEFMTESSGEWFLLIELSKWRVSVSIDGVCIGVDESLCTPFLFGPVSLNAGRHSIIVAVDNSMLHAYRPDSHTVSDCLDANWNGMAGDICLLNMEEKISLERNRAAYAKEHPVSVCVEGRNIIVNGIAEYMRGTHFGGGFYDTLYPPADRPYWDRLMRTVKEWGFNFIRFHSFCPPKACFLAADEAGVYLQVECGMWNDFNPEDSEMYGLLIRETRKILEWFGHHPSFIMLSPTNEPGGKWYDTLRRWVIDAKEINDSLGYAGRRLFTAQSGWYYDVPPADITGTDYIYFHRSAYGPIHGGMIRNRWGWRGKDYTPSVEGCKLPVIAHEMGQWCAYPDFDVIDKFNGAVRGGNYEIFRDMAERGGVLKFNKDFVYASGRAQLRLLKEDFEADFWVESTEGCSCELHLLAVAELDYKKRQEVF